MKVVGMQILFAHISCITIPNWRRPIEFMQYFKRWKYLIEYANQKHWWRIHAANVHSANARAV